MTRKDYLALTNAIDYARADIIQGTRHDYKERALRIQGTLDAARAIASVLADDNPRFDRRKFLEACISGPLQAAAFDEEKLARERKDPEEPHQWQGPSMEEQRRRWRHTEPMEKGGS